MNKNKKELYEENKRLNKILKSYGDFWETDAIEECTKQMRFVKRVAYIGTVIFLIASAFLIGLAN